MSLTTTQAVMTSLGITNPALFNRYDFLRLQAEQAVKDYVHWGLELTIGVIEYLDGTGGTDLVLSGLWACNPTVWFDANGAAGQANMAFSGSPLVRGQDYYLAYDLPGKAIGKSGRLVRFDQAQPMSGWWIGDYVFSRQSGLSYVNRPTWQRIPGSIKVQYDYGFVGAQAGAPTNGLSPSMPATIACAVIETVGLLASSQQYGGNPLQSEGLAGYSYSLASIDRKREFLNVRQCLAQYRDTSLGIALA